jgi:GTP-binding protein
MINSMSAPARLQLCLRIRYLQAGLTKPQHRQITTGSNASSYQPAPKMHFAPKLPPNALSYHWDTLPPTPVQLAHASKFFQKQPPTFLWSAEKFKSMDFGDSPEVCFLGRSNVGKSSLLNALLCRKIAHTSSKPGRTRLMNAFAVGGSEDNGSNRLVVLDMPGYGKGGRAEWGTQIMKYLEKRKELKRAFMLVDAEHGIKPSDQQLLAMFKEHAIPYQIVLAKADRVLFPGSRTPSPGALEARLSELRRTMESVKDAVQPEDEDEGGAVGEVIACSSEKWIEGKRMGIDAVRFATLQAAGLEYQPKVNLAKPVEVVPHEEILGTRQDG